MFALYPYFLSVLVCLGAGARYYYFLVLSLSVALRAIWFLERELRVYIHTLNKAVSKEYMAIVAPLLSSLCFRYQRVGAWKTQVLDYELVPWSLETA